MNSAVASGLSMAGFKDGTTFTRASIGYIFFDLGGAFLGTWFYRLVRPQEVDPVALQLAGPSAARLRRQEAAPRVCAEFIGTMFIVLTKYLTRADGSSTESWSMLAVTAALVYSLRDVSGAYFNPAVTVAVTLSRRGILDVPTAVWDIITQLFAGFAAAFLARCVVTSDVTIRFGEPPGPGAIAFAESAFTGLLCYVVLATSTVAPVSCRTKQNNIAGIAYGGAHMVAGVAARHLSGSLLNPVVALSFSGINAFTFMRKSQNIALHETCAIYVIWEMVGAIGAALVFFLTHAHLYAGLDRKPSGTPASDTPRGVFEA